MQCMEKTIVEDKVCRSCAELDPSKPYFNADDNSCKSCEEAGMKIDISGTGCVSECGKSQTLSGNTCKCAKHYELSDDGFHCKSTALETSTITAIVIGCLAVVVLAAFLAYALACTKSAAPQKRDDNLVLRLNEPAVVMQATK